MPAIGGDILEVTYNHPTLGSGTFFPKAGEDSTFDPGGFRGDDDANGIDGGGRAIRKLNRARWSFEVMIANDMNTANDLKKIADLAASPVEADWTVAHVNGSVWRGNGNPVGDVNANGNAGTMNLKVSGGGTMKKISG
jgi:hypothetical protein